MEKPYVESSELAGIVNRAYKPKAQIGSGSTVAAIRYELITGEKIFNKLHSKKGKDLIRSLEKWRSQNPFARPCDQAAAENIIKDLYNALGE